jgi:hypothetical protein
MARNSDGIVLSVGRWVARAVAIGVAEDLVTEDAPETFGTALARSSGAPMSSRTHDSIQVAAIPAVLTVRV